ncbi:MAG: response regulator receiver [Actinomycetia bacterium]|nr:response regulator receiver [Actinomycetes bacterium]
MTTEAKVDARPRVLCVDDEASVLAGLVRILRRHFALTTEGDGQAGLATLDARGPFEVVVSDLQMPRMDGITFLTKAQERAPDTVRILLTGNADLQTAVAAINNGQIFRFLCKPTSPDELVATLQAATAQHRLIVAERELLDQTLRGSVQTLLETLALASPRAFARASRIRQIVAEQTQVLGVNDWTIEVAAALSQLGAVTLPLDLATKLDLGEFLTEDEQATVSRLPRVTEQLLAHIPRLEPVCEIIREQTSDMSPVTPLGARMLRVAADFDALEAQGLDRKAAVAILRERTGVYDWGLLDVIENGEGQTEAITVEEVRPEDLRVGMVLVKDLTDCDGVLLVGRGHAVNESMQELIRNHVRRARIVGTVAVSVRRAIADAVGAAT